MVVQSSPLGIVAGRGAIVDDVISAVTKQGRKVAVVGIKGEAEETPNREMLSFVEIGKILNFFKKNECKQLLLIGSITQRPDFKSALLDAGTLIRLPRILAALKGGDDSVLSSVIKLIERESFQVIGVEDVAPSLLAGRRALTATQPGALDRSDCETGLSALSVMSDLDIGQSVIVSSGRIVAVEAAEGTDAMIDRVNSLRANGRLSRHAKSICLVKMVKSRQDRRVDLPTIGPQTVEAMISAGISGAFVEANGVLIAERVVTLELAEKAGLFLYGVEGKHYG